MNHNCTTYVKELMETMGIKDTGITDHKWQIPQRIKEKLRYDNKQIEKLEAHVGCYPGAAGEQLKASITLQSYMVFQAANLNGRLRRRSRRQSWK